MLSSYTNKNLKGCKSLVAYKFFISSDVHDVTYQRLNNLPVFCYIKAKVKIKHLSFFISENIYF